MYSEAHRWLALVGDEREWLSEKAFWTEHLAIFKDGVEQHGESTLVWLGGLEAGRWVRLLMAF